MDDNRLVTIKDNICLNRIKQQLQNIRGITIINAMKSDEVEDYCKILNEINTINFPVNFTEKCGNTHTGYIEHGYSNLGCNINQLKWLIPYYNGEKWWVEIEIQKESLVSFFDSYFQHVTTFNFTFFDIIEKFAMDIELGENDYEYRVIKWK